MRIRLLLLTLLAGAGMLRAGETVQGGVFVWSRGPGIEKQKLAAAWDGTWLRIDQPEKRFSVLYRESDGLFIGLEHRDALYWKFDWLKLSAAVRRQHEEAEKMRGSLVGTKEGAGLGNAPAPKPAQPPATVVWHLMKPEGQIEIPGGPNATAQPFFLEGVAEAGGTIEARCLPKAVPDRGLLWKRFAAAAAVLRLVAVREMAPFDFQSAIDSLVARETTPDRLVWRNGGGGPVLDAVELIEWNPAAPRDAARFAPPGNYRETQLATLEGLLEEAPAPPTSEPVTPLPTPQMPGMR